MDVLSRDKVARIRELNDNFRNSFRGGQILLSASIAELPNVAKVAVLRLVADFTDFNEENDPAQEHDYGSFDYCNCEVWWKIDPYNLTMDAASEDPADPEKTKRIMLIGCASDW